MSEEMKTLVDKFVRYKLLKAKLNPTNAPFIIMDDSPEWKEFNQLTIELMPYIKLGV